MDKLWVLFTVWETYYFVWAVFALITTQKEVRVKIFLFQLINVFVFVPLVSLVFWAEINYCQGCVFWLQHLVSTYIGFILLFVGMAFSIWARVGLGKNWTGSVEVLPNHEIIRDGPYRIVRHPMYLGVIFGILGTLIIIGDVFGFILFVFSVIIFYRKSKKEEVLLLGKFGKEYIQYQNNVRKMLIPYIL